MKESKKEKLELIEEFKNWLKEKKEFLKMLYKDYNLRYPFEYIPSLLIGTLKSDILYEDLITEPTAFSFYKLAYNTLKSIIFDMELFYVEACNKDIKKLKELSNSYFLLFDLKEVINYYADLNIRPSKSLEKIQEFYIKLYKIISSGNNMDSDNLNYGYTLLDEEIDKLGYEYQSVNDYCDELTSKLRIPMHNLDL